MKISLIFSICLVSACSRRDTPPQVAQSSPPGADLITLPIDSVASGTGRYIEETKSYVPAPDTTHWLIVTRRAEGDVLRVVRGPVAFTAPTLTTLTIGVHAADSIGVGNCRRNGGSVARDIVAVTSYQQGLEWLPAIRAWQYVRAKAAFDKIPPSGVECLNEEGD